MEIRTDYAVPTIKHYTLTAGQQVALEFMAASDANDGPGPSGFVAAVRFLRVEFGLGLKEAKDLADHIFGRVPA